MRQITSARPSQGLLIIERPPSSLSPLISQGYHCNHHHCAASRCTQSTQPPTSHHVSNHLVHEPKARRRNKPDMAVVRHHHILFIRVYRSSGKFVHLDQKISPLTFKTDTASTGAPSVISARNELYDLKSQALLKLRQARVQYEPTP